MRNSTSVPNTKALPIKNHDPKQKKPSITSSYPKNKPVNISLLLNYKIFSNAICGIIATGQHECMEQLIN
jgi:hypothetical protein